MKAWLVAAMLLGAEPAAAQPAEQPAARQHVLEGRWVIQRLDQSTTAEIRITQVFPTRGVTNVSGVLVLGPGVGCPVTGSVIDDLTAQFYDDPEVRSFPISAFVTFRARCGDREYWIEALGLPTGTILMNGRMTEITPSGRGFVPVSIGRPRP